jgi:protein SCO1/2
MVRLLPFSFLLLVVAAVSCEKSPQPLRTTPAAAAARTNQQIFQVKGVVMKVKPESKEIEIKHEEVPGYMPAMTMPFDVKHTNDLAGIAPGDAVSFRMIVTDTEGWIDQIKKIGSATTNNPATAANPLAGQPAAEKIRIVRDVEPLTVGDTLPEYAFTNQFGQRVTTSQFKGQALAITFIFTRCPFPTFCPFTARNFAGAQQTLLARPGGPTNWQLLTISFDPEFDKPPVLKAFGETYKYDPAHWTLATGSIVDIMAIGEQFGLVFQPEQTGTISHNLRTVVIDAAGRVQKIIVGNSWTSDELAEELAKAAAVKPKSEPRNHQEAKVPEPGK